MMMVVLALLAIVLSLRVGYLEASNALRRVAVESAIAAATVNPPVNGGPGGRSPGGSRITGADKSYEA